MARHCWQPTEGKCTRVLPPSCHREPQHLLVMPAEKMQSWGWSLFRLCWLGVLLGWLCSETGWQKVKQQTWSDKVMSVLSFRIQFLYSTSIWPRHLNLHLLKNYCSWINFQILEKKVEMEGWSNLSTSISQPATWRWFYCLNVCGGGYHFSH